MSLTSDAIRYQCYHVMVSVRYIFISIWSVVFNVTDFPRNSLPMLPCNCIIYKYIWSVVFVCGICGLHLSRVPQFLILVKVSLAAFSFLQGRTSRCSAPAKPHAMVADDLSPNEHQYQPSLHWSFSREMSNRLIPLLLTGSFPGTY